MHPHTQRNLKDRAVPAPQASDQQWERAPTRRAGNRLVFDGGHCGMTLGGPMEGILPEMAGCGERKPL